ncbi:hypothetical protein [Sinomicrobium sp.]
MKTILKNTIWLFFIAVAVSSCSDNEEDNCDPNDKESFCYEGPVDGGGTVGDKLLLIELKTSGKPTIRYEYDNQNHAILMGFSDDDRKTEVKYHYSGDNMVEVEYLLDGELVSTEEYNYSSGDKPTSGVYKDREGEPLIRIEYSYSGNEVKETFYDINEGKLIDYNTYRFDDKGNSVEQIINVMGTIAPTSTTTNSDFDDKPSAATHRLFHWKLGFTNNAQAIKSPLAGIDHILKYTYNEAGYPTKMEAYDRGTEELVETSEFVYKKAN